MPQAVLAVLRKALPTTKVFLMYGLTEAFRSTYLPPSEVDRRPTSMGKAIPDTEILVRQRERPAVQAGRSRRTRASRSDGFDGLLGPPGGYQDGPPSESAAAAGAGRLRKGLLFRRSGENGRGGLSLLRRPPRHHDQIFGIPDQPNRSRGGAFPERRIAAGCGHRNSGRCLGQTIKAFVVPRDGQALNPDALIAYCAEKMPRYMVPKAVEILDELAEDHQRQSRLSRPATQGRSVEMEQDAWLIDRYFAVRNGELLIGRIPVSDLAAHYGTPLFVYDASVIDRKWGLLRDALPPEFSIYYSVKANPSQAILSAFSRRARDSKSLRPANSFRP